MPGRRTRQVGPAGAAVTLALAVAAVTTPALTARGEPCSAADRVVARAHGWTTIQKIPFPVEPVSRGVAGGWSKVVQAHAVDPTNPRRIYAANTSTIMRSSDGGCSWERVYTVPVPQLGGVDRAAAISSIVAPESSSAHDRIYAVLSAIDTGELHVIFSPDGGRHWERSDLGLPPSGARPLLRIAPSDPDTMYLVTMVGNSRTIGTSGVAVLFVSGDAGRSWAPRGALASYVSVGLDSAFTLTVDPLDARELWAGDRIPESPLLHSTDGGGSWRAVGPVTAPRGWAAIDVFHERGSPARVLAVSNSFLEDDASLAFVSEDGGASWRTMSAPPFVGSMVHGATADDVVLTTQAAQVFIFHAPGQDWLEVHGPTDPPPEWLVDLQAARTADPAYLARSPTSIEMHSGPWDVIRSSSFCTAVPDRSVPVTRSVPQEIPRLLPQTARLDLGANGSRTMPYRLELPPLSAPLDVYLLVDTTISMTTAICGLRVGLHRVVRDMAGLGIDAHFGVGEFRDFPPPFGGGDVDEEFAYRRDRDIGPVDQQLVDALAALSAQGGGDAPEATLPALYQAATGAGQDSPPPGPGMGDLPPGLQANFRPDALKVIVTVTDAPFRSYLSPSRDATVAALKAKGIRQVGLAIHRGGVRDLQEMASRTGAVAPAPGVDCDGDGDLDLRRGAPLVCTIDYDGQSKIGGALAGVLRAITDAAPVELAVDDPGGVVRRIDPRSYSGVDLRRLNRLPFDVNYSCVGREARAHDVVLSALVRGRVVAAGTSVVLCGVVPAAAPPLPPPAAAVQPPPIGQAPKPVSEPESQPAPNAQGGAQAAAVPQRQEQPQTALVRVIEQVREQDAMALSARRQSHRPATGVAAGAALVAAIALWGQLARHRASRSTVRARRKGS